VRSCCWLAGCVRTAEAARPCPARFMQEFLSWGCPKIAPPSTFTMRVHSRVATRSAPMLLVRSALSRPVLDGLPSARACHSSNSFRPCRSSRLRRFSPRVAVQVCCTLQPTMGFARLRAPKLGVLPLLRGPGLCVPASSVDDASCSSRSTAAACRSMPWELASRGGSLGQTTVSDFLPGTRRVFPARVPFPLAYYPSKSFPRRQPCRVTAASAPSPLLPLASTPSTVSGVWCFFRGLLDLEALLRLRVRCYLSSFPTSGARYFLGLMVRQVIDSHLAGVGQGLLLESEDSSGRPCASSLRRGARALRFGEW
jgi:hypothetical protein